MIIVYERGALAVEENKRFHAKCRDKIGLVCKVFLRQKFSPGRLTEVVMKKAVVDR